jgi:hypothetical protein
MSGAPVVTIGLPVYDSRQYVEESLDSVLTRRRPTFVPVGDNARGGRCVHGLGRLIANSEWLDPWKARTRAASVAGAA